MAREDQPRPNLPLWAFLVLLVSAWFGTQYSWLELIIRFAIATLPCAAVLYYGKHLYKSSRLWTVVLSFFVLESALFLLFLRSVLGVNIWAWGGLTVAATILLALIVASSVPEKEERMAIPEK